MYHPNHTLLIAHERESELVNEAKLCGLPKVEADGAERYMAMLAIATCVVMLAIGLRLAVG